jgi:xanthine dehydrogenase accessory factor
MRDLYDIHEGFTRQVADGHAAALATVVGVEGSSYRRPGAMMLIAEDGSTWGTISGGCLDADVSRRGRLLIATPGLPVVVAYETDDDTGGEESAVPIVEPGPSLGCGGRIEILIERVSADSPGPLAAVAATVNGRKSAGMATVVRTGSVAEGCGVRVGDRVIETDGKVIFAWCADKTLLRAMENNLVTEGIARHNVTGGGWAEVFVQRFRRAQAMMIFGEGRDVVPLVELAASLGWQVTVIGSRPEAALRRRFARAAEARFVALEALGELSKSIGPGTAVLVMEHNLLRDGAALAGLLQSAALYVGVLGPRHRTQRMLKAAGAPPLEEQPGVHSPVGLDIGAETPEQIAISIVAEILAVLSARPGGSLRSRPGPIHGVQQAAAPAECPQ